MIFFYLYVAVLAQSGEAHYTYAVPYKTTEECQAQKQLSDRVLEAETHQPNPDNAAAFLTVCVPVVFHPAST